MAAYPLFHRLQCLVKGHRGVDGIIWQFINVVIWWGAGKCCLTLVVSIQEILWPVLFDSWLLVACTRAFLTTHI